MDATVIAVAVMPVFGILMYLLDLLGAKIRVLGIVVRTYAAYVYAAVLCAGVGMAAVLGALTPSRLIADPEPVRLLLALIAVVPCAVLPYLVELKASSSTGRDSREQPLPGGREPGPASGTALFSARESVQHLAQRRWRYAALAVFTAIVEELLFRGAMLPEVSVQIAPVAALLASSLVFGFHHVAFGFPSVLGKTVAGLLWGSLMLLSGIILVPILAHLLFQYLVYRRVTRRPV